MTNRYTRYFWRGFRRKTKLFVNSFRLYGRIVLVVAFVLMSALTRAQAQSSVQPPSQHLSLTDKSGRILVFEYPKQSKEIEIVKTPSLHQLEMTKKGATTKRLPLQSVNHSIGIADWEKRQWVKKAADQYNIDWRYLEAVWMVESGKRWISPIKSYAGATGPCQFLGSTWRRYAVDGNGDGKANITEANDCLFGAARLLSANGASQGDWLKALLAYNHSRAYVHKVERIAQSLTE